MKSASFAAPFLVLAILSFGSLAHAQSKETKPASEQCPTVSGTHIYDSGKPHSPTSAPSKEPYKFTENDATYYNYYGLYCEDIQSGVVAAEGYCIAAGKCIGTKCAGTECNLPDLSIDDIKKLGDTETGGTGTGIDSSGSLYEGLFKQGLLNPTPLSEQKDSSSFNNVQSTIDKASGDASAGASAEVQTPNNRTFFDASSLQDTAGIPIEDGADFEAQSVQTERVRDGLWSNNNNSFVQTDATNQQLLDNASRFSSGDACGIGCRMQSVWDRATDKVANALDYLSDNILSTSAGASERSVPPETLANHFLETANKVCASNLGCGGLEAKQYASLLAANAQWETGLKSKLNSDGIAQVTPRTASFHSDDYKNVFNEPYDPLNAKHSIQMQSVVLSTEINRCGGDLNCALRSYNAGYNRKDSVPDARTYANRVLANYSRIVSGESMLARGSNNTFVQPVGDTARYYTALSNSLNSSSLANSEGQRVITAALANEGMQVPTSNWTPPLPTPSPLVDVALPEPRPVIVSDFSSSFGADFNYETAGAGQGGANPVYFAGSAYTNGHLSGGYPPDDTSGFEGASPSAGVFERSIQEQYQGVDIRGAQDVDSSLDNLAIEYPAGQQQLSVDNALYDANVEYPASQYGVRDDVLAVLPNGQWNIEYPTNDELRTDVRVGSLPVGDWAIEFPTGQQDLSTDNALYDSVIEYPAGQQELSIDNALYDASIEYPTEYPYTSTELAQQYAIGLAAEERAEGQQRFVEQAFTSEYYGPQTQQEVQRALDSARSTQLAREYSAELAQQEYYRGLEFSDAFGSNPLYAYSPEWQQSSDTGLGASLDGYEPDQVSGDYGLANFEDEGSPQLSSDYGLTDFEDEGPARDTSLDLAIEYPAGAQGLSVGNEWYKFKNYVGEKLNSGVGTLKGFIGLGETAKPYVVPGTGDSAVPPQADPYSPLAVTDLSKKLTESPIGTPPVTSFPTGSDSAQNLRTYTANLDYLYGDNADVWQRVALDENNATYPLPESLQFEDAGVTGYSPVGNTRGPDYEGAGYDGYAALNAEYADDTGFVPQSQREMQNFLYGDNSAAWQRVAQDSELYRQESSDFGLKFEDEAPATPEVTAADIQASPSWSDWFYRHTGGLLGSPDFADDMNFETAGARPTTNAEGETAVEIQRNIDSLQSGCGSAPCPLAVQSMIDNRRSDLAALQGETPSPPTVSLKLSDGTDAGKLTVGQAQTRFDEMIRKYPWLNDPTPQYKGVYTEGIIRLDYEKLQARLQADGRVLAPDFMGREFGDAFGSDPETPYTPEQQLSSDYGLGDTLAGYEPEQLPGDHGLTGFEDETPSRSVYQQYSGVSWRGAQDVPDASKDGGTTQPPPTPTFPPPSPAYSGGQYSYGNSDYCVTSIYPQVQIWPGQRGPGCLNYRPYAQSFGGTGSQLGTLLAKALGLGNSNTGSSNAQNQPTKPSTPTTPTPPKSASTTPVVNLIANPKTVFPGGLSLLSWSSVATERCYLYIGTDTANDSALHATGTSVGQATSSRLATTTAFTVACTAKEKGVATTTASTTVTVQ
jgi:hypothetical protein